jgi:preprotein translocase subunit YajC
MSYLPIILLVAFAALLVFAACSQSKKNRDALDEYLDDLNENDLN